MNAMNDRVQDWFGSLTKGKKGKQGSFQSLSVYKF